ncbi:MAG: tetratricopeptide repeat protein [Chitinophagaceae bacterium]|nr:tetratricopeptide repeat protein [Chitinophagaceae bacterium]
MLRYSPHFLGFIVGFSLLLSCSGGKPSAKSNDLSTRFPETEKLNSEIASDPKNADLYFKRGKLLHKLLQDSLALIDFQQAVKLDSTKATYFSAIGDILFEHKDISGSISWIQKAITINPDDETAHLKIAKLFLYTAEYPKAFAEINTVLRSNVYNPEAYFLKGMCYKGMKDTNKAISSFQTAVQTEPKFAEAHLQLALLHEARKDPLALKYYENAFKADTTDLEPIYGQAMFWQNQENFPEAKKVLNRIISIDRQFHKAFYNMGWMLLQEDSVDKAERQFSIALELKPDYAEAYYNRGLCKEIQKKYPEAYDDYQQALSFIPEFQAATEASKRVKPFLKK